MSEGYDRSGGYSSYNSQPHSSRGGYQQSGGYDSGYNQGSRGNYHQNRNYYGERNDQQRRPPGPYRDGYQTSSSNSNRYNYRR
ncbi:hypothetical protein GEV33_007279 [Tenebrio molitor]|uniref:Uncharacterized protein n=1 Tax=Tenebrio molitor TaxID=7067 RepID=A0A8J6LCA2_TENMO|nr:hypothetical protein GEV33_007279 [Tenebrio molitor]